METAPSSVTLAREPLADVLARLASGEVGASSYARALLDRMDEVEPILHATVDEPDRRGRVARELGAAADGPLAGIPVGVKDIIRAGGLQTRAGSRLDPELFEGEEASCVTTLRRAGAIVAAKTVTTEFAFFDPGPTRNPHHLEHTPGGSSSGSAAGVAAGLYPVALGTQTIGSIIRPAAYCGVVGFKPSFGRVPTHGVVPCSPSADTVGLFTQDAAGMRLAARTLLSGWREPAADGPPLGVRNADGPALGVRNADGPAVGVPDGPFIRQASPEALDAFESRVAALGRAGLRVVRVPCLDDHDAIVHRHRRMVFAELARTHAEWFAAYEHRYGDKLAAAIRAGREVATDELEDARASRLEVRDRLTGLADEHAVDVWASPAALGPAPLGLGSTGEPLMNLVWTHTGMPAATVPAGRVSGLPVGFQLAARYGDDERLLGWAELIADVIGP